MISKLLVTPLVLLMAVTLYYRVYDFGYVWDDWALFVNSAALRDVGSFQALIEAVTKPILPGTTYFRPAVLSSFVAQFLLFGAGPLASHVTNLSIFCANVVLLGFLIKKVNSERVDTVAVLPFFLAITVYVVHPAQIESVAWVSGRFDLLFVFFTLLCLNVALMGGGVWIYSAIFVFYVMAAMSKESAVMMPAIFAVLVILRKRDFHLDARQRAEILLSHRHHFLAMVLAGLVYLCLKSYYIGALIHVDKVVDGGIDIFQRLAFVGHTALFYVRLLLWPFSDVSPQHPFDPSLMGGWDVFVGLACFGGLLSLVVILVLRANRASLLVLALVLSVLPVLNAIPLTIGGNIGHDRFLAFPLVVFSLLVHEVACRARSWRPSARRVATVAAAGWVAVSVLNVWITVPLWKSDLSLWKWAFVKHPDSPYIQFGAAAAAMKYRHFPLVEEVLERASAKGVPGVNIRLLKGAYHIRRYLYADGISEVRSALKVMGEPHKEMLEQGVAEEEVARYLSSFVQASVYSFGYTALAEGYIGVRQFRLALDNAKVAVLYDKGYPPAMLMQALAWYGLGDMAAGDSAFERAMGAYHPDARGEVEDIKASFMVQLCRAEAAPVQVCNKVGGGMK